MIVHVAPPDIIVHETVPFTLPYHLAGLLQLADMVRDRGWRSIELEGEPAAVAVVACFCRIARAPAGLRTLLNQRAYLRQDRKRLLAWLERFIDTICRKVTCWRGGPEVVKEPRRLAEAALNALRDPRSILRRELNRLLGVERRFVLRDMLARLQEVDAALRRSTEAIETALERYIERYRLLSPEPCATNSWYRTPSLPAVEMAYVARRTFLERSTPAVRARRRADTMDVSMAHGLLVAAYALLRGDVRPAAGRPGGSLRGRSGARLPALSPDPAAATRR